MLMLVRLVLVVMDDRIVVVERCSSLIVVECARTNLVLDIRHVLLPRRVDVPPNLFERLNRSLNFDN